MNLVKQFASTNERSKILFSVHKPETENIPRPVG